MDSFPFFTLSILNFYAKVAI